MNRDRYDETFGKDPFATQEPARRGPGGAGAPPKIRAVRHDVFVIYRPLHACPFCSRRLHASEPRGGDGPDLPLDAVEPLDDPGEREYLCPHVRRTEYQKLLDDAVAERVSVTDSAATTLGNGTVQILVTWSELARRPKLVEDDPEAPR